MNGGKEIYWSCYCPECGWQGMSNETEGGNQIADTGDYTDVICPKCIHDGDNKWQGKAVPVEEQKGPQ